MSKTKDYIDSKMAEGIDVLAIDNDQMYDIEYQQYLLEIQCRDGIQEFLNTLSDDKKLEE